jgi:hypothetical protein
VPTSIAAVTAVAAIAPMRQVVRLKSQFLTIAMIAWADPAMPASPSRSQITPTVRSVVEFARPMTWAPTSQMAAATGGTAIRA